MLFTLPFSLLALPLFAQDPFGLSLMLLQPVLLFLKTIALTARLSTNRVAASGNDAGSAVVIKTFGPGGTPSSGAVLDGSAGCCALPSGPCSGRMAPLAQTDREGDLGASSAQMASFPTKITFQTPTESNPHQL